MVDGPWYVCSGGQDYADSTHPVAGATAYNWSSSRGAQRHFERQHGAGGLRLEHRPDDGPAFSVVQLVGGDVAGSVFRSSFTCRGDVRAAKGCAGDPGTRRDCFCGGNGLSVRCGRVALRADWRRRGWLVVPAPSR
jgi:hypothetical protein